MDWWESLLGAVKPVEAVASTLLAVTVLAIMAGRLVPKSTVDDVRRERDSWKEAYVTEARAGAVKDGQLNELMEVARTAQYMYRALPGGDARVVEDTKPTAATG